MFQYKENVRVILHTRDGQDGFTQIAHGTRYPGGVNFSSRWLSAQHAKAIERRRKPQIPNVMFD